jgi:hypothetical protein
MLFCDAFNYGDGSVVTNSAFQWATRSGALGECQVQGGHLWLAAGQTEDIVAPFIGAPYNHGNATVLYAAFKVDFLTLPKAVPGLFAHFADGTTLRGRILAGTTNAGEGHFRLHLANGASAPVELPVDLYTNTTYQLVERYSVDSASTTLWLNPSAESDEGLWAGDVQTAAAIASYGFRQDPDFDATVRIDDLRVGLSFGAVTGESNGGRPMLAAEFDGNNLRLSWPDSSFILQWASAPEGPFLDLPDAASPFSVPLADDSRRFFRLKR